MRYVLTVDGVPVGLAVAPSGNFVAGHLEPFPSFVDTGLASAASRLGEALTLSHGPHAKPSPRQRRLRAAVGEEKRAWQSRLGLLDERGTFVPTAGICVIWFALCKPFVILDFRLLPLGVLVRSPQPRCWGYDARPAA